MRKYIYQVYFVGVLLGGAWSCVSMDEEQSVPKLTEEMTLPEAINLAVKEGEPAFTQLKERIVKRDELEKAHELSADLILRRGDEQDTQVIWRLVNVHQGSSKIFVSPRVVQSLISDPNVFIRQIGWLLAANRPSDLIAAVLDRQLTRSVVEGEEEQVLLPEMALAVKANQMRENYSMVKMGLMTKGGVEFVEAMISLSPADARFDLMDYLALATVEDLRQMNQTSVDMQSCLSILRFYTDTGLPLEHPRLEHVFLYAVSRNAALSDAASIAVAKVMDKNRSQLAYILSRLPVWIQVAFVENHREQMNANLGLFFTELKMVTAHKEVVDEINAIIR